MHTLAQLGLTTGMLGLACLAAAADINIPVPVEALERQLATEPFSIVAAEISRPKVNGDITLKAEVSFSGNPPVRVKLRRAEPGAEAAALLHALEAAGFRPARILAEREGMTFVEGFRPA